MSRTARFALFFTAALWYSLCITSAHAGALITHAFEPGKPLPPAVLQNVPLKGVVAEFLDPDESGLGKEIGFLIWREILTAISDQKGAGVILARPPGNARLTDLLRSDYHDAALRIAASQDARMAVWGAVDEHLGRIHIDTYLSLLDKTRDAELALHLKTGDGATALTARIPRTTFNFAPVVATREALFSRRLVTRASTPVRANPGAGTVLATVSAGTVLQADDMRNQWFSVKLADGRSGYVDIAHVEVPPRQVELPAGEPLKREPSAASATVVATQARETGMVMDMRYLPNNGLWYQVTTAWGDGWVAGWRVRPRFSLPAVHFIAGIYRYQVGRWDDAVREFEQFVQAPGVEGDNASLSTAYQLLGASRLMQASDSLPNARGWDNDFALALRQTPYDPAIYTMRAIAQVAVRRTFNGATLDLAKALELDPSHADARNAVTRIDAYVHGKNPSWRMMEISPPDMQQRQLIDALATKYHLRPY